MEHAKRCGVAFKGLIRVSEIEVEIPLNEGCGLDWTRLLRLRCGIAQVGYCFLVSWSPAWNWLCGHHYAWPWKFRLIVGDEINYFSLMDGRRFRDK